MKILFAILICTHRSTKIMSPSNFLCSECYEKNSTKKNIHCLKKVVILTCSIRSLLLRNTSTVLGFIVMYNLRKK